MKISLVQMKIEEDYKRNIEKVANLIKDTINSHKWYFRELFTTGFNYEYINSLPGNHHSILSELPMGNTYVGSIVRKVNGYTYNSFFEKRQRSRFPLRQRSIFSH